MSDSSHYVGSELELFRDAKHWKAYVAAQLHAHLFGDVLEVGAGIGGTTVAVHRQHCNSWTCLEPDPRLVAELRSATATLRDGQDGAPAIVTGTLANLEPSRRFDCVLYLDVLEHIEDDGAELARAAAVLRPGGQLIVLSPAWNWLYSPFDAAIGHYRRYSRSTLLACAPQSMALIACRYLDCAGIAVSLANRVLMRNAMPTRGQIQIWDRWLVPASRRLDGLVGFRLGKSILAVWKARSSAGGPTSD